MAGPYQKQGVVAFLSDLIFETKLNSTARTLGVDVTIVKSYASLCEVLKTCDPAMVLVDLNSAGRDANEAIETVRSHRARPYIISYVSHVDIGLAGLAEQAGADEVLPRSQFNARLPQLLQRHGGGQIVPDPSI